MIHHFRKAKRNTIDKWHKYCCVKYPRYAVWHEHQYHSHTHWFVFIVFFIGWVMGLSFQLWWFPVTPLRALSWHQVVELDSGTNDESSIALAANGTIGMTWYDSASKRLRYSYCSSNCASSASNWTTETVDGDSDTDYNAGLYPVLAFNGNIPGIMYYQSGNTAGATTNARYAVRDSGATGCGNQASSNWSCETVYNGGISGGELDKYYSLTYDSTGQARASWANWRLYYGIRKSTEGEEVYCSGSSTWQCVQIPSTLDLATNYATLMLDGSNNPSVVYKRSGDIKFATCTSNCMTGSNWSTVIVSDDTANDLGNATDAKLSGSTYHVTTVDSTGYDIIYYTCTGSCATADNWSSAVIADNGSDYWTSSATITVNASGAPRIAFFRNGGVNYATCDSSCTNASNWSTELIASAVNDRPGLFVDSSGNANISFADSGDDMNYALSSTDTPPALASLSVTGQATDGTGYVTFSVQVSDVNNDATKAKIEYSDDGGTTWYDPILVTGSTAVSSGSVDTSNDNAYQIGTVNAIDTDVATITLTVVWDTKSALNAHGAIADSNANIRVRVTANDGTFDGTKATSSNFTVDNVAPAGLASFAKGVPTATTMPLTWIAATDLSFGHYEIWYGETQSDVQGRIGTASEWDNMPNDLNLMNQSTATTTITGLSVNTRYYFKIWAIDNAINETTLTDIDGYTGVNAPGTPTVNGATASTLNIAIDTNSNPASTEYAIQEDGSALYVQTGTTKVLGASEAWQTAAQWGTVTVTGLSKNTSYAFGVKARNGNNLSVGYFSTAAAYTAVDAPTNFRATTTGSASISVAVDSFSNDYVSPAGYRFQITAPITADSGWQRGSNTYTFSSLLPKTQYTFSVTYRTTGSVEVGPATLQVTTTPTPGSVDSTPPRPVTAFTASAASDGNILLTWIDPPDADLSEIIILRSVDPLPISGNPYARVTPKVRRFVDTDVTVGKTYHYILKAIDNASNFSLSAQQTVALLSAEIVLPTAAPATDENTPIVTPPSLSSPATAYTEEPSVSAPRAAPTVNIKELIRAQYPAAPTGVVEEDGCVSGKLLCTLNRFFRVQNIPGLQFFIDTFIPSRRQQESLRTSLLTKEARVKIVGIFGGLYDLIPKDYKAGGTFTPSVTMTIRYNPRDAAILLGSGQSLALVYFNPSDRVWEIVANTVQNIPEGSWTATVQKAGTYGIAIIEYVVE